MQNMRGAAPTAGLHFTKELLDVIKRKVNICTCYPSCRILNILSGKVDDVEKTSHEFEFYVEED